MSLLALRPCSWAFMMQYVVHFNIGCQASVKILEEIGISPGHFCKDEAQQADSVQVLKANYKEQGVNKSQWRLLRDKRKKKN